MDNNIIGVKVHEQFPNILEIEYRDLNKVTWLMDQGRPSLIGRIVAWQEPAHSLFMFVPIDDAYGVPILLHIQCEHEKEDGN